MRLLHRSDSLVTSRRMARFSSLKLRCEFASEVELGDAVSATKRKGHKRNAELKNPVIIKNSLWLYCSQAFVKFGLKSQRVVLLWLKSPKKCANSLPWAFSLQFDSVQDSDLAKVLEIWATCSQKSNQLYTSFHLKKECFFHPAKLLLQKLLYFHNVMNNQFFGQGL